MPRVICSRCDCLSHNKDGTCGASQVVWRQGKCNGYINAHSGMRQDTATNLERRHGAMVEKPRMTMR